MHKSASSMTSSVGSQPPTARKSARRKNMAREASALPPSTASTSAGGGSSAESERNSRGSPAASFSIGITMATPVIVLGSLPQPRPERQVVRTVEVGERLQHGEKTQENSLSKGRSRFGLRAK